MKKAWTVAVLMFVAGVSFARSHSGYGDYGSGSNTISERVSGYSKQDGTYVQPYHRTVANETKNDNYSTRGNENPYTGKTGYGKTDADTSYGNKYGR